VDNTSSGTVVVDPSPNMKQTTTPEASGVVEGDVIVTE